MKLRGKIMRVVNMTVVITLFLSTLNVNAVNTPVSSEPPEPMISSGSVMAQPVFEEPVSFVILIDNSALNEVLP